jgi:hypothetical protein
MGTVVVGLGAGTVVVGLGAAPPPQLHRPLRYQWSLVRTWGSAAVVRGSGLPLAFPPPQLQLPLRYQWSLVRTWGSAAAVRGSGPLTLPWPWGVPPSVPASRDRVGVTPQGEGVPDASRRRL